MVDFEAPWALVLAVLPALVRWLPGPRDVGGAALTVPEGIGAGMLALSISEGRGRSRRILPLLLWLGLVVALAGPRLLVPNPALPVSGRDLVLALDLSGSMVREDFEIDGRVVSRLDALKHAATGFVEGRAGDRVALVVFGSKAYFATPQTYDVASVARAVAGAEIGISGRATGISDALGLSLKRLRDSEARGKVVILLSDGVNNSGPVKPRDAARLARQYDVRVHTIAMGPRDLSNADGERDAVDAETLSAIAELSGGRYFRVRTTADLLEVTAEIDRLEAIPGEGPSALLPRQLWIWPAGFSALCALMLLIGPFRT